MATPSSLRHSINHLVLAEAPALLRPRWPFPRPRHAAHPPSGPRRNCGWTVSSCLNSRSPSGASGGVLAAMSSGVDVSPVSSGAEEVLMGFIMGKRKSTEVAHEVWKNIVRKGDRVVDATCGNGHDTLALLKMVKDDSCWGFVYGMDIQKTALESTSSLLNESIGPEEKKLVNLFHICHSKMEDVVPKDAPIRLVAFNLGYLPGGDKTIVTLSPTTLSALQAASRILEPGGLISVVVYVGHPGGRDEYETVQSFVSSLPAENWVCSKFEVISRPNAPVLVLMFKR